MDELNQLVGLFGGQQGVHAKWLAWIVAAQTAGKLFAGLLLKIQEWFLTRAEETKDDWDDHFAKKILESDAWRLICLVVDFTTRVKLVAYEQPKKIDANKPSAGSQLLAIALAGSIAFSMTACGTLSPGADPVVVRAEQSLKIAFDTFDTFLRLEMKNADFVKAKIPEAHKFAEWLREKQGVEPRGVAIIRSAEAVKDSYKANRTPENKAALTTALATVESALRETQKHLTEIK